MEKMVVRNKEVRKTKHVFSLPYKDKIKKSYFIYASLFLGLSLLVYISSLFIIINLSVNNNYFVTNNFNDINITITPILDLILITASLTLLFLAPNRIHHSAKQSSIMFYFSFWMLVVSTMLNSQLQLNYTEVYANTDFYNWLNIGLIKIIIVLSVISLFFVELFFWIKRRKFTFMSTDYEIYAKKSETKQAEKAVNSQKKLEKKHEKLKSKIQKTQIKDKNKLNRKLKKEALNEK